jgi:hypothetical protein
MKELLYVIGAPGVGKSSAVRLAMESLRTRPDVTEQPFLHLSYPQHRVDGGTGYEPDPIIMLGGWREGFGGTDTLPMNVQPKVLEVLEHWEDHDTERPGRIIAEGDRLANDKFFVAASWLGWNLTVISLEAPPDVLAKRRRAREQQLGTSPQNESWVRGRETKAARLAEQWCFPTGRIDTVNRTPRDIAEIILAQPMFRYGLGALATPDLTSSQERDDASI